MVVILQTNDFELPDNCGYNKIFQYNWITPVYGLSMSDMNYNDEKWFEKQNMVLSFEDQKDLIFVKISIDINK